MFVNIQPKATVGTQFSIVVPSIVSFPNCKSHFNKAMAKFYLIVSHRLSPSSIFSHLVHPCFTRFFIDDIEAYSVVFIEAQVMIIQPCAGR